MSAVAPHRPLAAPARPRAHARDFAADHAGALVVAGLAAVFVLVAFVTRGGTELDSEAPVEIALLAGSAALGAVALVRPGPARAWGAVPLWLFAALAVWTALSIGWSISPNDSWLEANRTLAYLGCFAGGIALARLLPDRPDAIVGAVAVACLVVSAYAFATKCLPGHLATDEFFARLRAPFDYWNATALVAGLGVPACLWFGARREGSRALAALAYPATCLLLVVVALAYSRGVLVALTLGLVVWFAASPVRLRSAAVLGVAAGGAAVIAAWAFTRAPLSQDLVVLPDRVQAGYRFGLLSMVVLLGVLLVGWAINAAGERRPLTAARRRLLGMVLIAAVALGALGGVAAVAASPGGISHAVSKVTDPNAPIPGNTPSRLTAAGSIRAKYWQFGFDVWKEHRLIGSGAGGFDTAHKAFTRFNPYPVGHAHGWVPQTLSDLGLVGLAISALLLLAWLRAAVRTAPLRRRRGVPDADRAATLALLSTVVVFGVHNLFDWTWFIPGTAVVALVGAGWLAGRGPFPGPAAAQRPAGARRSALGLVGLLALAVLGGYAIATPLRAQHKTDASYAASDRGAIAQARSEARSAAKLDPLSATPWQALATADVAAGDEAGAREAFTKAVRLEPSSGEAWRQLGEFELDAANDPAAAVRALGAGLRVDRESQTLERSYVRARRTYLARHGEPSFTLP